MARGRDDHFCHHGAKFRHSQEERAAFEPPSASASSTSSRCPIVVAGVMQGGPNETTLTGLNDFFLAKLAP